MNTLTTPTKATTDTKPIVDTKATRLNAQERFTAIKEELTLLKLPSSTLKTIVNIVAKNVLPKGNAVTEIKTIDGIEHAKCSILNTFYPTKEMKMSKNGKFLGSLVGNIVKKRGKMKIKDLTAKLTRLATVGEFSKIDPLLDNLASIKNSLEDGSYYTSEALASAKKELVNKN